MNEFEISKREAMYELEGDVYKGVWYHLHTAKLELITTNLAEVRACMRTGKVQFFNRSGYGRLKRVYRKLKYIEREKPDGSLEMYYKNEE